MKKTDSDDTRDYEVGYGKPPVRTRFKKGQSGNPKGRPRGTLSMATLLDRVLREQVVINEGGRRSTVTKFEVALMQLVNSAAAGDLGAMRLLFTLTQLTEAPDKVSASARELVAADRKVIERLLGRIRGSEPPEEDK